MNFSETYFYTSANFQVVFALGTTGMKCTMVRFFSRLSSVGKSGDRGGDSGQLTSGKFPNPALREVDATPCV